MRHRLSWISWIPLPAIGIVLTAVYAAWIAAYSQLGRRPMPSMDDPKSIGGVAAVVCAVMAWIILVSLAVWLVGMIMIIVIAVLPQTTSRKSWIVKAVVGIAAMAFLVLMVRYSPGDAFNWILD